MRAVPQGAAVGALAEAEVLKGLEGTAVTFCCFSLLCLASVNLLIECSVLSCSRSLERSVSRSRSASPIKSSRYTQHTSYNCYKRFHIGVNPTF